MDVRNHDDPQEFMALADSVYAADPVRHTLALTVIARFIAYAPSASPSAPVMVTVHDGDALVGVAVRTPPWPLIASGLPVDPSALDAVADVLRARDPGLPASPDRGNRPRRSPRSGPLARAPVPARSSPGACTGSGSSRRRGHPATLDRRPRTTSTSWVRWRLDFRVEALGSRDYADEGPGAVRRMLDMGDSVTIWSDAAGTPVSWAVGSAPIRGMSRVGPVYTPKEHRGHGYGSAVTAATSKRARDHGAHEVLLFTDLANPTSNSIYQKIGYRPVYDSTELEFIRLPSTT